MKGARYFFHVAADYRLWAPDPREIERNNLQGAQATMGAALKCGVERVVYTSSVAALKPGQAAVDETSRHTPQSVIGAYKRSKLMAEREVERLVRKRASRRDRGAVHAHRPARHQAHAHGPHHRRSRHRQDAGLCRYRAQSGACR